MKKILFLIFVFLFSGCAHNNFCPTITSLAFSCGNRQCDTLENARNCPGDCLNRRNHVIGFYDLAVNCPSQRIFHPSNEQEASRSMHDIVSMGNHVTIVGTQHTGNSSLCGMGDVISTSRMNHIHGIEMINGVEVVSTEPGTTFRELLVYLESRGKTLGYISPGYQGLSIGGFLATGAHGSVVNEPANLGSIVEQLNIIGSNGEIQTFNKNTTEELRWRALNANVGLLGLVSRISLKVQPKFNVLGTIRILDEAVLFDQTRVHEIYDECNTVWARWIRSVHKVYIMCGSTTQRLSRQQARFAYFDIDIGVLKELYVPTIQAIYCSGYSGCKLEQAMYLQNIINPPWIQESDRGRLEHVVETVGSINNMVGQLFPQNTPHFSANDWEVAVSLQDFSRAIEIIDQTMDRSSTQCFPIFGVLIRFDRVSNSTILSGNSPDNNFILGEQIDHIEFQNYRPYGLPDSYVNDYNQQYYNILTTMITELHARPHWGKNADYIFSHPTTLEVNHQRIEQFNTIIAQMDPNGTFATNFHLNAGFRWSNLSQSQ